MKVLVVGSGGREHALCYSFRKGSRVTELFCASGNAGIAQIATCIEVKPDDVAGLADFASSHAIDLTFVGGETSLALGVVDEFESLGLPIVGPNRSAARLESSKAFAKDFMARHRIPTAKYESVTSAEAALSILERGEFGNEDASVVVKADGLAAGKGVIVAADRDEACAAVNELANTVGADAAATIVLEECLSGPEVSLLAFVSGSQFALMPPVRDHKRIGDGDTGPNTGGMGTFTDASILSDQQLGNVIETIVKPTLKGCVKEDLAFCGILFVGLMVTPDGPKVLEYNIRFGDPETQAILVRLETDLVDICEAMLAGDLSSLDIKWKPGSSACVVLASEGYPAKPRTGDVISGLENVPRDVTIFHAGTSVEGTELVTAGGRVLGVTATGDRLQSALSSAYAAAEEISWQGIQYRTDIGRSVPA